MCFGDYITVSAIELFHSSLLPPYMAVLGVIQEGPWAPLNSYYKAPTLFPP